MAARISSWRRRSERTAIREAFELHTRLWMPHPDRTAIPTLRKTAAALAEALRAFEDDFAPEKILLLALLQAVPPMRPQHCLRDDLLALALLLARLEAATVDVPDGRGPAPDVAGYVFVCFAADAWLKVVGEMPTAGTGRTPGKGGEDSRFMLALQAFSAEEPTAPVVTRDLLRKVLPDWAALREGQQLPLFTPVRWG